MTLHKRIARKIVRLIHSTKSTVEDQGVLQDLESINPITSTPSSRFLPVYSFNFTSTISDTLAIPNHWRPEIEQNIQDEAFSDNSSMKL